MDHSAETETQTNQPNARRSLFPTDGHTAILAILDEAHALVAGRGDAMSASMPILLNGDPNSQVQGLVVGWTPEPAREAEDQAFLALVPLRNMRRGHLESIVMRGRGKPVRYSIPAGPHGLDDFLEIVGRSAGASFPEVIDGLAEGLIAGDPSSRNMQSAAAILQKVSRNDGCVEVVGRFEEGEVFVQGWAQRLSSGRMKVIAIDHTPRIAQFSCGIFERDDLGGRGQGYAGLLETPEGLDPQRLQRLLYRGRDGWNSIEVYDRRVIVDPRSAPGHVRAVLPRLVAASEPLSKLRRAANRFDGRETISELPLPVRIGIDLSVEVENGGILLSGWLLDPDRHVEAVLIRSGGKSARLDDIWTANNRRDVSAAYCAEKLFAGLDPDDHSHGFIAFAQNLHAKQGDTPYIEIRLKNGYSAYEPLSVAHVSLKSALTRLLSIHDPSTALSSEVIEHHYASMVFGAERNAPEAGETVDSPEFPDAAQKALVIGTDACIDQVGTLLALVALDPLVRSLPIVLAGPRRALAEHIGELKRVANFYHLCVRIVLADGVEDSCDALEAGIAAAPADTLVCLSSHVLPRLPGWIAPLERAFRARNNRCIACPTILYEDDSIRWAGMWIKEGPKGHGLEDHYAGYPRGALFGAEPSEVAAGTLECCMLSRSAFAAAGGFTRGYLGTEEKSLDAALKMRRAGVSSIWVPQVEMLRPEERSENGQLWPNLAKRVDRQAFDRRWSLAISNMNG
ncbi:hypothetical protein GR183_05535 [Stappia sp. GBMRC 2046]|uniref:Uncharacterized protein n=1 Tax=Stappia sediminis TaxID=2692190 RepID=A0A7X3LSM8_9HYPH|nr:hypothetical protein [Stappia sediminis]MXN64358.1 hypothetical protein [Stappia sediminis]